MWNRKSVLKHVHSGKKGKFFPQDDCTLKICEKEQLHVHIYSILFSFVWDITVIVRIIYIYKRSRSLFLMHALVKLDVTSDHVNCARVHFSYLRQKISKESPNSTPKPNWSIIPPPARDAHKPQNFIFSLFFWSQIDYKFHLKLLLGKQ